MSKNKRKNKSSAGLDPQVKRSFFTKDRDAFRFTCQRATSKTKKDILYNEKNKQIQY